MFINTCSATSGFLRLDHWYIAEGRGRFAKTELCTRFFDSELLSNQFTKGFLYFTMPRNRSHFAVVRICQDIMPGAASTQIASSMNKFFMVKIERHVLQWVYVGSKPAEYPGQGRVRPPILGLHAHSRMNPVPEGSCRNRACFAAKIPPEDRRQDALPISGLPGT